MKSIKTTELKLNSTKESDILEAITLIADNALVSYLPSLAEKYSKFLGTEIAEKIETLFNDLRHKEAIPVILPLISNNSLDQKTKLMLISSCWQSGMDYSEQLMDFVPLLKNPEFIFAFEAFTVIESNIDFLDLKNKLILKDLINKVKKDVPEDISMLCEDLIEMLDEQG